MKTQNKMPMLKNLFRKGQPGYEIVNKANSEQSEPSEIYVYDFIGPFGVEAEQFAKDLKAINGDVVIRFNSPGGFIPDGMAMANAIREHKGHTTTVIDGMAASSATYPALSGNTIRMNEGATLMIHNSMNIAIGNAKEMRKVASILDKFDDQIRKFYARRTGKELNEIKRLMDGVTWFNGEEAKEAGFVDEIFEDQLAENCFDLSIFNNVPEKLTQSEGRETRQPKDLEKALRDAGLSRQEAKAVLSNGLKAIEPEDTTVSNELWAETQNTILQLTFGGN